MYCPENCKPRLSFTTLRLLTEFKIQKRKRKFYKFCDENMCKSFFSDTNFDILKMESFGSEELALLYTNMLKSQNFDGDMSVKPNNLHNSIQMKQLYKIHKIRRHCMPFLNRFSFRIIQRIWLLKYTTHRLHSYITSLVSYFIVSKKECLSNFENVCGNCVLCYMLIKLFVFCKLFVFLYVPCLYAFRYFSIHHIVDRWPDEILTACSKFNFMFSF